jgi:hypothetical protein
LPDSALRYTGSVAVSVLPSPVRISAILPSCSAMPPISCTSKWRIFMTRLEASRTTAKASGSSVQRLARPPALELLRLAAQGLVVELFELGSSALMRATSCGIA